MSVTTREEASETLDGVLDYFDGDSAKLLIFLGQYLAGARGEPMGGLVGNPAAAAAAAPDAEVPVGSEDDLMAAEMIELQNQRRKMNLAQVQKRVSQVDPSGRRLSQMEQQQIILESALEIAEQEEQEDVVLEEEAPPAEDEDDIEASIEYKFLPYVPMPRDEVDVAVAEYVNLNKLDILITRKFTKKDKKKKGSKSKNKNMKRVYKLGKKSYTVRYVHQILICRDANNPDATWEEFGQILERYYEDTREE